MALPLLGIAARVAMGSARAVARGGTNIAFNVARNDLAGGRILRDLLPQIRSDVSGIATDVHDTLRADTPKDTGTASRGWRRKDAADGGFTIRNTVEHIGSLNEGSSKQAPRDYVGKTIRNTQIK